MRIVADARSLNRPHLRGIGKYLSQIVTHSSDTDWELLGDCPDHSFHRPRHHRIRLHVSNPPGYRFRTWEQIAFPRSGRRLHADVMHAASTTAPVWQPVPTVVTIHDVLPWHAEEEQGSHWYWHRVLPAAYRRSAAIITISECSRRGILQRWPELQSKMFVIPHGIDEAYLKVEPGPLPRSLSSIGIVEPYLLYVGGDIPRKRLEWAFDVFRQMNLPHVQLVVCGVEDSSQPYQHWSPSSELRVCFAPFVAEVDMPRLYQNAVAVLYPTLYEGFGLPALEAQSTGTPVLFSDVGSLSELKGPGACVLAAHDMGAWVETCRQLASTRATGDELNHEARSWARRFSWEKSAKRHAEVFRFAAQGVSTGLTKDDVTSSLAPRTI
jgi:alpha-1,3-rhamnosyl/mannosyltransferase